MPNNISEALKALSENEKSSTGHMNHIEPEKLAEFKKERRRLKRSRKRKNYICIILPLVILLTIILVFYLKP